MAWSWISPIAVAIIGVIGSAVQVRRGRARHRDLIKQDLELYSQLPESSAAKKQFLKHIDAAVTRLIADEEEKSRSGVGVGLGIFFMLLAVGLAVAPFFKHGWWWFIIAPAVFIGLLGLVGFTQDVVPRRRDERGRPIE
jgi:Flp pilus assembly protein TadB